MAAPARRPRALLALGLALLAAAAAADPFSPQLGDTGGCRGQCGRSLQRRAAADAVLNACYRGCRLFSICHFVDASAELNTTRAECEAACAEAYGNAEEQFGCVTGCRKQLPEVEESRKEKSLELEAPSFSVLDLVSTFCNDIVSSAQSFISSTWTFYLQADDGKVVVFQSQPEMEYPAPEALEIQPAQPGSGLGSGSSPGVPQPHTGPRAKGDKPPAKEARGKAKAQPGEPPQQEHDFLGCMSKRGVVGCYRRSGLPRWILAACLFLSVMVMLWLSCASLVTAPEQHVRTQPLSINGDKEYLEDLDGPGTFPLPPVIAVTLCPAHGGEDAGPLPLKVDLDKTIL
ncbi:transmembrane protein 59-like isoform X1 [Hirundo rustica]|uniref:transmembrane protein 59-like isoform X1 n=1 Tax=Hirundo rustica TaxID=43150 RepID=UPI001A94F63D|nr:transmembrane protein 59-like isoform X1 [Hirundo rustica]